MIKNQTTESNNIEQKFQTKIKSLQEYLADQISITNGNFLKIDYNDDIQREKAFYEFALGNLNQFKKNNLNKFNFSRIDQEFLFQQSIGEIVMNPIIKSAVHVKNIAEKELNTQGKKLQLLIASKKSNKQKHEKLVEEIKKAMKKKPVDDNEQEQIQEIQQMQKNSNNKLQIKKGIKKKKTKRLGKMARLHQRLKKNSKKQK